ncbi:MAG: chorismate mutase [Rhodospirillales bacterium]|nr:chorismate mutase [Rhodospirillales bacterium]
MSSSSPLVATPAAPGPAEPAAAGDAPAPPDGWSGDLTALRAELDRIDDELHDLLVRRAAVVERVAATKPAGSSALRPGREAAIIRRLLARHHGGLPPQGIVRIWREMLAATTAMQGPFGIAVCEAGPGGVFTQAAREQFGALTPVRAHHSAAQAIADVSAGRAAAAVLPLPNDTEPLRDAWWTWLLHTDAPRIHVVSRLPFWSRRAEGAPDAPAFVVAAVAPDASGDDRSLIGLELDRDVSRARLAGALAAASFALDASVPGGAIPGGVILRRDPDAPMALALVEVAGFVTEDDARLAHLGGVLRPPVVLGAYAVPVQGAKP